MSVCLSVLLLLDGLSDWTENFNFNSSGVQLDSSDRSPCARLRPAAERSLSAGAAVAWRSGASENASVPHPNKQAYLSLPSIRERRGTLRWVSLRHFATRSARCVPAGAGTASQPAVRPRRAPGLRPAPARCELHATVQ